MGRRSSIPERTLSRRGGAVRPSFPGAAAAGHAFQQQEGERFEDDPRGPPSPCMPSSSAEHQQQQRVQRRADDEQKEDDGRDDMNRMGGRGGRGGGDDDEGLFSRDKEREYYAQSHPMLNTKESKFGLRHRQLEHEKMRQEGKEPNIVRIEQMNTLDRTSRARALGHAGHTRATGTTFYETEEEKISGIGTGGPREVRAPRARKKEQRLPFFLLALANPGLLVSAFTSEVKSRVASSVSLVSSSSPQSIRNKPENGGEVVDVSVEDSTSKTPEGRQGAAADDADDDEDEQEDVADIDTNNQIMAKAVFNAFLLGLLLLIFLPN